MQLSVQIKTSNSLSVLSRRRSKHESKTRMYATERDTALEDEPHFSRRFVIETSLLTAAYSLNDPSLFVSGGVLDGCLQMRFLVKQRFMISKQICLRNLFVWINTGIVSLSS